MTGVWAALIDARTELRIHRGRVLLSLFGVAVAIAALVASVAMGTIMQQIQRESNETWGGKPATIQFGISVDAGTATPAGQSSAAGGGSGGFEASMAAFDAIVDRYHIKYASPAVSSYNSFDSPFGRIDVSTWGVAADYAVFHRVQIAEGRWLMASDAQRLAPAVVISRPLLEQLGYQSLSQHPTLSLPDGRTGVVVGVLGGEQYSYEPSAYFLADELSSISAATNTDLSYASFEVWVGESDAKVAESMVKRDLKAALPGASVDAYRSDYAAYEDGDPTKVVQLVLVSVSAVILGLGALSLVTITLITVRQRVREIGIRRAFGASRVRIFFSVMLESVVGTVVAGFLGVLVMVLAYRLPIVGDWFADMGLMGALPPFPFTAAVVGMVTATAVGALAGIVPAVVAVRAKVIDAIRF